MKKVFHWIVDKWLAGFITTSLFFLLKLYIDLPAESKAHFWGFKWLIDLLQTQIALSTLIIIVVAIIILTRIEKAYVKNKSKKRDDDDVPKALQSHFESYRQDIFGINKTTWTWRYEWRAYDQKFVITELKPSCRRCETPMEVDRHYLDSAVCHRCRLEGRQNSFQLTENYSDVEKEIIRRLRDNEVKKQ